MNKLDWIRFYSYKNEEIYQVAIILYKILYSYITMVENKKVDHYFINRKINQNGLIYEICVYNPFIYSPDKTLAGRIIIKLLSI